MHAFQHDPVTVSHRKWVRDPKFLVPVVSSNTGYLPVIFRVSLVTSFYWSWFFIKASCLDFKTLREGDLPIPLAACSHGKITFTGHMPLSVPLRAYFWFEDYHQTNLDIDTVVKGIRINKSFLLVMKVCLLYNLGTLCISKNWHSIFIICNAFSSCSQIIPVALCCV